MKRSIESRALGDRVRYAALKELECRAFIERVLSERK
jgi:hypothetical protein